MSPTFLSGKLSVTRRFNPFVDAQALAYIYQNSFRCLCREHCRDAARVGLQYNQQANNLQRQPFHFASNPTG